MPKKVVGFVKLALAAGKATPAPPVGPALGQHGANIVMFCKEYNAKTCRVWIQLKQDETSRPT